MTHVKHTASETQNHVKMKHTLRLTAEKEKYGVEFEFNIKGSKTDVLIDNFYAIEIQVSPCTNDYVFMKREVYREAGYHPVWIFVADRDPRVATRLNSVLKKIFLRGYGKPYDLNPWAFLYFPNRGFVLPHFDRVKEQCDFSPANYINKYKMVSPTRYIAINDFLPFLDFYMRLAEPNK